MEAVHETAEGLRYLVVNGESRWAPSDEEAGRSQRRRSPNQDSQQPIIPAAAVAAAVPPSSNPALEFMAPPLPTKVAPLPEPALPASLDCLHPVAPTAPARVSLSTTLLPKPPPPTSAQAASEGTANPPRPAASVLPPPTADALADTLRSSQTPTLPPEASSASASQLPPPTSAPPQAQSAPPPPPPPTAPALSLAVSEPCAASDNVSTPTVAAAAGGELAARLSTPLAEPLDASRQLGAGSPPKFHAVAMASNLRELHLLCREQGVAPAADTLVLASRVNGLKHEMISASRRSHALQIELQELERMIALHIRHRMEVEDKGLHRRGAAAGKLAGGAAVRPSAEERGRYETLTYLIRVNPGWLARLVGEVGYKEKGALLHLILNVIYADMHDGEDDALLLSLFGEALEQQTRAATDKATFMRDNTALTELLAKYNERDPGREALVGMLRAPVTQLLEREAGFSLDPSPLAVYRDLLQNGTLSPLPPSDGAAGDAGGHGGEDAPSRVPEVAEAAALPEVAAEMSRRVDEARRVASSFLSSITSKVAVEVLRLLPSCSPLALHRGLGLRPTCSTPDIVVWV